ncbi:transmembrane protein 60 [Phlebotomus argentipes]|uniref:transmembrane protein 60 n=1 Tax=Phlebotomus argentipes TaxID=94469 RepID=UPI0028932823|nr:transmembrane protein 60 [Phlebotomus argentipes]XP_059607920.1 transmembrane protein 60 [Phlebotomus argentipes]
MTLVHRALFTWFIVLVFLILLCLRLETRTHWNWFVVFIPLWIFDAILLIYVLIKIVTKWRNLTRLKELLMQYQSYICTVLLKIAIQIMICLKLEYPSLELSIFTVMIPIWILLPATIAYVFMHMVRAK